jgi:hypothetical protein
MLYKEDQQLRVLVLFFVCRDPAAGVNGMLKKPFLQRLHICLSICICWRLDGYGLAVWPPGGTPYPGGRDTSQPKN